MKVQWKYDILFYFNIAYTGRLQANDFLISPTNSCRKELSRYNLLFKQNQNGGYIISEKKITQSDELNVLRKIDELTSFTFMLVLKNQNLFSSLSPFSVAETDFLPDFIGRRRLLYFDNLDGNQNVDDNLTPFPNNPINNLAFFSAPLASSGYVSEQDLGSLVPNEFSYTKEPEIDEINISPLHPGDLQPQAYSFEGGNTKVKISLQQSGYVFQRSGAGGSSNEIVFAGSELIPNSLLGVIQIYKNETTDYSSPIRYDINFEQS